MSLTAEQLAVRKSRVGSSEIGALIGVDPYKSAFDLFLEKTLPAADDGADHQTWGLDLEPSILTFHARKRGYTLIAPPENAPRWPSYAHPTLPLVCTPDGLAHALDGKIALQAKNDQGYGQTEWGDPNTDDAPMLYLAQTTVEMGVLLAKGVDIVRDELVVSIRGAPPVAYPVKFDHDLFTGLAEIATKFVRDHLETGKPPEMTPPQEAEYIRRRYAKNNGTLLQPTDEILELWADVQRLRAAEKAATAEKETAETALKAALGEADGIEGVCTWKLQKGSTYMVTKEPSRVLRAWPKKKQPKEG